MNFRPKYLLIALSLMALGMKSIDKDEGSDIRLIESDEDGVVIELLTPTYRIKERREGNKKCYQIKVKGYGSSAEPGKPLLPIRGVLIGIPPEASFTIHLLEADSTLIQLEEEICPSPSPIAHNVALSESFIERRNIFEKEGAIYSTDDFYPTSVVEVTSSGFIREQRFVRLEFHPFRYNPISKQLEFYNRIRAEVRFAGAKSFPFVESPFEKVLKRALINYESAKGWRVLPTLTKRSSFAFNPLASRSESYKIEVDSDGIYKLAYDELRAAGLDVETLDPRKLKLYNQGQEIAIWVEGEEDGSFDPDDYILFYGRRMKTRYTDVNVYWLSYGEEEGKRMQERDGTPTGSAPIPGSYKNTIHSEEDKLYDTLYPGGKGDHWFWTDLKSLDFQPYPSQTYTTTLRHPSNVPFTATLRASLQGYTDNTHHLKLYINDNWVGDAIWNGDVNLEWSVAFTSSYLIEGINTLRLESGDKGEIPDGVWFDWFELDYKARHIAEEDLLRFSSEGGNWEYHIGGFASTEIKVFDITDPEEVVRITGVQRWEGYIVYLPLVVKGRSEGLSSPPPLSTHWLMGYFAFQDSGPFHREYLALSPSRFLAPLSIRLDSPSNLRSQDKGADYVIITHADFRKAAESLAESRREKGLRVEVVDIEDVYDEFSYGIFEPEAIKDFLAYAYSNWKTPAPTYVLLFGDGTYDFKDNYGFGSVNYIPPYLAMVDPWMGEAASDNRYVTIRGDDVLPEMLIGRLPLMSASQAKVVVDKIISYEDDPPAGPWNQHVLFVADKPDEFGNDFGASSDEIFYDYLPPPFVGERVYYAPSESDEPHKYSDPEEAKSAIIAAIERGMLLVSYIGHSSYWQWAIDNLFNIADIPPLENGARLPFVLSITCFTGYFHHPERPALDEAFVTQSGGGAIGAFSPTGLGVATGHDLLHKGFYRAVFGDGILGLGEATLAAKVYLYERAGDPVFLHLVDTFVLLGEPAVSLNTTFSPLNYVYLPLVFKKSTTDS